MSMSSSSGSTWSEADPWSEQAKYLSGGAEGGKSNALFDSAYQLWNKTREDKAVNLSRPHVFGESASVQNSRMHPDDWALGANNQGGFIRNARQGELDDQYISTVADFMQPQTDAQGKTVDLSNAMYNQYMNADGSIDTDTSLQYLLPRAFDQTSDILGGTTKIATPTMNAATLGGYNNMGAANVGTYNYPVAATVDSYSNMSPASVANLTQGINRDVGNVAQQGGYSSTFGFDSPLNTIATGGYVGGNQYLDDMYSSARDKLYKEYSETLLPQWDTQAEAMGRDDSNVWAGGRADLQGNYLDSLGDLSSSLYGNAYEGDMNRMLQGLGLGAQQSQFEDTMTQDINRYNTDIQNRKKFEEAGYDYGADSLLANLQANQFLQNAGYQQEANKLTSDQSLQKALANAGYSQEASMRKADLTLQEALAEAGYAQEANRLTSEQSLQKALTNAQYQQEANRANPQFAFDTELQNLANRMAMAQYAPDLAMRAYDPIQQEAGVGDIQQQQAQSELDAAVRQGEFLESIPTNMLGTFANMISGNYGGTQMTESESGK